MDFSTEKYDEGFGFERYASQDSISNIHHPFTLTPNDELFYFPTQFPEDEPPTLISRKSFSIDFPMDPYLLSPFSLHSKTNSIDPEEICKGNIPNFFPKESSTDSIPFFVPSVSYSNEMEIESIPLPSLSYSNEMKIESIPLPFISQPNEMKMETNPLPSLSYSNEMETNPSLSQSNATKPNPVSLPSVEYSMTLEPSLPPLLSLPPTMQVPRVKSEDDCYIPVKEEEKEEEYELE